MIGLAGGRMETLDAEPRGWDEGPGLLQAAWRYNWIVAFAALLGALLGYGWASRQPVLYQGTSRLLFGSTTATLLGQVAQSPGDPERYLNNQVQLIGSSEILKRAAERSGVQGASADSLAAQMTVEAEHDADVITITVLDPTPRGAARLADAVGAAYQTYVADQPRRTAEEIRSVNNRLQDRLGEIETALRARPPSADAATLRLERDAITKQQRVNAEQLAAITAAGGSNPVRLQEESAVPQQPSQPATRRTVAIGVLFGLVVGVALAWLLSTRRSAAALAAESAAGPRPWGGAAGRDATSDAVTDEAWPVEAGATDRRGPATVPSGNGVRSYGDAAPLVRGSVVQERQFSSAAAVEGAAAAQPPEADGEVLIDLLTRLEAALAEQPLGVYHRTLPQVMAEELTNDAFADLVVVLLDDGAGSLEVVGSVGLAAEEQPAAVDQGHGLLRQALDEGVSVVEDASRLPAAAGIPGAQTVEPLVLLPLVQRSSWVGMLVVGRRSRDGRPPAAFNDGEIENLILYAADCVPLLNSLLLLRRLQQLLAVLDPSRA
jgi:capsular polysaccharide biosynthesis protein